MSCLLPPPAPKHERPPIPTHRADSSPFGWPVQSSRASPGIDVPSPAGAPCGGTTRCGSRCCFVSFLKGPGTVLKDGGKRVPRRAGKAREGGKTCQRTHTLSKLQNLRMSAQGDGLPLPTRVFGVLCVQTHANVSVFQSLPSFFNLLLEEKRIRREALPFSTRGAASERKSSIQMERKQREEQRENASYSLLFLRTHQSRLQHHYLCPSISSRDAPRHRPR